MPLAAGTKLGAYEVIAPLGAGGMGEVYRARDPRLGRDVAIKLIPDAFAADADRLARFEREARLLASLQHANVAVLHGLEQADGRRFLVMECVEGESLAKRVRRGPLPLAEVFEVGRAVAAALEAAHEAGIVHRDLKPGNIMVTNSGDVKVLDFGLAKGGAAGGSGNNLTESPTITSAGTEAGVILGTAAYMSPEQARGKAVDRRTDIWSFGCVLYECLTGRQCFSGETVSDIVARILQVEPEWSALPAATPEHLRTLLRRCLEKDARRRLRDIGEARIEIEDLLAASRSGAAPAAVVAHARRAALPWAVVAITAAIAVAATWFGLRLLSPVKPPAPTRFEVPAPKGLRINTDASVAAISPDGRTIAMYAADSSGVGGLWFRRLDSLEPRPVPGSARALMAFWSPDSRWLAYFDGDEQLVRVAVDGGAREPVCAIKSGRGGSWGRDGTILLAPYSNGGIFRVPATGGTPVQVTKPDSAHGVTGHRFPAWLPDGKHFLFISVPGGPDGKNGLCVGSVDGGPIREIARVEAGVVWTEPGWLVGAQNGGLVAWPFDRSRLRIAGDPVRLGDPVVGSSFSGAPYATAAADGSLAFLTRRDVLQRLRWFGLDGRPQADVPVTPGRYAGAILAPDARRALLYEDADLPRPRLLLADLERGAVTPISDSDQIVTFGSWSRDGRSVAWVDELKQEVCVRSLADGSVRRYLAEDHGYKRVYGFTSDGGAVVIGRLNPTTKWDIWRLPLDGKPPVPILCGPANEQFATVSPDGRWIAYQGDESGTGELYVVSIEGAGVPYPVTIGGGGGLWARDRMQVCYFLNSAPNDLLVADARTSPEFSLGPARPFSRISESTWWNIDFTPRRVLAVVPAEKAVPQAVTVLEHWRSAVPHR